MNTQETTDDAVRIVDHPNVVRVQSNQGEDMSKPNGFREWVGLVSKDWALDDEILAAALRPLWDAARAEAFRDVAVLLMDTYKVGDNPMAEMSEAKIKVAEIVRRLGSADVGAGEGER